MPFRSLHGMSPRGGNLQKRYDLVALSQCCQAEGPLPVSLVTAVSLYR